MATTPPIYNTTNGYLTDYGVSIGAKAVQPGDPRGGTTTTTTAPKTTTTSSTSTSTSTKAPTGIASITSTLNLGSQGDQVKALQTYLAGLGYTNADGTPLKVDGIYGPKTQTAVMQFQSQNGLTADGIFGPKSLAATNNLATTSTVAKTPTTTNQFNTGDTSQDSLLGELRNFIQKQQDAGLKINPDLTFDQHTLDQFLQTAKSQVHPYYQSQIDTIRQDVQRDAPEILANYGRDVASQEAKFKSDLNSSREDNANRGLAYSGFRGQDENNMAEAENRTLAGLGQQYGDSLYNLGREAESKVGASNMSGFALPQLSNYSSSLSGAGGFNNTGTASPYTPGGYGTGSLQYDEAAATEARNQALKDTASSAVVNGRTYQDLIK